MGTEYDPFVLESLEQDSKVGPPEPTSVYKTKGAKTDPDEMSEVKKMKFKSKYDKNLTRTDKIEMQLKQVFSKYYGQVNEDMRGTLKEYDDFERAYNEKDIVALRTMLKKVNFNYKKNRIAHQDDVAGYQGSYPHETK